MRALRFAMVLGSGLLFVVTTARADVPSPVPSQSAPLDIGSRTSGLGLKPGAPVAQPQPPAHIDVTAPGVASGSGPDTPGKTGLGNTDRGPAGGAATGPGTEPKTGGPVGLGTPAPPSAGTR
jgi:hypothetical protein